MNFRDSTLGDLNGTHNVEIIRKVLIWLNSKENAHYLWIMNGIVFLIVTEN